MPDLILWNKSGVKFSEVKSTNDRLSEYQKAWLQYFGDNNIDCEVCLVNWEIPIAEKDAGAHQIDVFGPVAQL